MQFFLAARQYQTKRAHLCYHLEQPLILPEYSFLLVQGENGAGKTTFVEEVLLPHINTQHTLLYLAQDIDLKRNAMAATLAVLGHEAPAKLSALVQEWVHYAPEPEMLIMDEFSTHIHAHDMETLLLKNFCWVICISHGPLLEAYKQFTQGYALSLKRSPSSTAVFAEFSVLWSS